ncbi:MAG TPA: peptidyl-prolyl cis-trans isomerase [Pirellulales bacterium]|nr:peptidyl-prolyl cis-trans isomerase [Pirellulales bacterium]
MSRARQAPYTQLRLDSLGGGPGLEITQPIPVPSAKVVGRVGDEIILAADVLPQVNEEFQQIARQIPPDQQAQYFEMLMARHVKQLVQFKLVALDAKKGVEADKIKEMKKSILSHFETMAQPALLEQFKCKTTIELDAKLKEHGSSLAKEMERFFEQALISEWMRREIKYDQHVSHEELLTYYHEHRPEFEFKAKVRFEEIRISYGKKRSRHDAWLAIRGLADRVYAGASMAELAKAHSESLKAENGGLHDWTNEGSLACKQLDDALFRLPVGALSNIIDDDKGHAFVVVRVVERASAGVTSFRDAQIGIRDKIRNQRKQAAQAKRLTEFLEENKFRAWTIYDDLLREMEEKAKIAAKKQSKLGSR